jgi:type III restriction enzyme
MKLKFKKQLFQTDAVNAVADCFAGQPKSDGVTYRIDPGKNDSSKNNLQALPGLDFSQSGFKNRELVLTREQLLENIQAVQQRQNLPQSTTLVSTKVCAVNLDIEMETGTGKTYCYIKTMFEMNRRYGWSRFIVVVPSVAIREGVYKSFEITAEHFMEQYNKRTRFFIYNSKQLHHLEQFSSDGGINVQAFNARGQDARRIYEELDDFQSRKPIDVISKNHPIMILDEPQKLEGAKTFESLKEFAPLAILRYSATHRTEHNKIHRLDALDAYNQKLVKKIAVRGITVRGLTGTNAYLYLESIQISATSPPIARIEFEVKQQNGIKRIMRKFGRNDNLFDLSGGLSQYKGFVIADIDAVTDTVSFTNGEVLEAGEATGDAYSPVEEKHKLHEIFTVDKKPDFSRAIRTEHHVYDYVFTDSTTEKKFVTELDKSVEVVVYAKLPRGFFIPTPVGNYNPDWAIAFKEGSVKHIYFVAETKGSMSSMELRKIEEYKIDCARKFFTGITTNQVKYDVVSDYAKLMNIVK